MIPDSNKYCNFCGAPVKRNNKNATVPFAQSSPQVSANREGSTSGDEIRIGNLYKQANDTIKEVIKKSSFIDKGIEIEGSSFIDKGIEIKKPTITAAVVILIIILIIILTGNGGMKGAAEEYVSNNYDGRNVSIVDYENADSEDLEYLEFLFDEKIKEAKYDVEVTYTNEYGEDDSIIIDIIYKDKYGWHAFD